MKCSFKRTAQGLRHRAHSSRYWLSVISYTGKAGFDDLRSKLRQRLQ
jgi:hypothetical protein